MDSFIAPDHFERFENNEEGIVQLAAFVRQHSADMVVMESSGGIERVAFYQLWAYGIACAIINPRSVRDFAKAMGYLEKTDRIDAKVMPHFAATKGIIPTPAPSINQQRLSALKVLICRIILKRLGVAQAWKCSRMRQVVSDLDRRFDRIKTAL